MPNENPVTLEEAVRGLTDFYTREGLDFILQNAPINRFTQSQPHQNTETTNSILPNNTLHSHNQEGESDFAIKRDGGPGGSGLSKSGIKGGYDVRESSAIDAGARVDPQGDLQSSPGGYQGLPNEPHDFPNMLHSSPHASQDYPNTTSSNPSLSQSDYVNNIQPTGESAMPRKKTIQPAVEAAIAETTQLAAGANSLEELRQTIADYDGLSVKKTATNMVFSDGNPDAKVMVIGEAPGADEDMLGKPFVGASGQLLDKILGSIGLSRAAEEADQALYISNILNWRPPGNRTPTPDEMAIAKPFIEKHIALVKPRVLVLVGAVPYKTLLGLKEGIMKARGKFYDYEMVGGVGTAPQYAKALPTFHPAFLLRNPKKKKDVWQDMLTLKKALKTS